MATITWSPQTRNKKTTNLEIPGMGPVPPLHYRYIIITRHTSKPVGIDVRSSSSTIPSHERALAIGTYVARIHGSGTPPEPPGTKMQEETPRSDPEKRASTT